jgi:FtsP/CotA-like multicopper oxidase with cupredoxin domain
MLGEGNRSTRFTPRNTRWAHNRKVTWLPEGGPAEDLTVFRQQREALPPAGNNGNGSGSYNGNGNGHHNGNGNGDNPRKVNVSLSEEERERLKAEVVYWGLQQSQQGRMLSEEQLQEEYDRRLHSAEQLLYSLQANVQQEYDRARAAEQMLRDREEERQRQAPPFLQVNPGVSYAPQSAPQQAPAPGPEPDHWKPKPVVSRRNALKLIGLLGIQGAAAVATVKVMDQRSTAAAQTAATNPNGIPQAVLDAGGGPGLPDSSADTDVTQVDHPVLAAFNNGSSLFAPFSGALAKPNPANLAMLHPVPALPAQAGRVKEFTLSVTEQTIDLIKGFKWAGWMYNGTIPGPVLRVTQGDTVRVTLDNSKAKHPHSIHFHSIHPGNQDGVFQIIPAGGKGTYTFTAEPFGVFPYHCHIAPFDQHVARGLYGTLIIDPPTPRPPANEMVMLLNGYDTTFSGNNDIYSVNGLPGYYQDHPIPLKIGQLNRVYIVNMTEHDELNSFHLHGNLFNYIPLGTALKPSVLTDVAHLGIADRGIAEFVYKYPGQYLFHAHQTELSMKGWSGIFNVT